MELTETFFFTYVNIKKPFLKFSKTFIQQRIGAGLHAIIIIFFLLITILNLVNLQKEKS